MPGYKNLLTYKLTKIIFNLTWEFVPDYYYRLEDGRQRDQMKQAARSYKQNNVEGSEERSLSSKLKLYDVSRSSGGELLEDYEDILSLERLPRWDKNDSRLTRLRLFMEGYPSNPSNPPVPSCPSCSYVLQTLGKRVVRGNRWTREETEIIANYLVDLISRANYLLDRQINAVEEKHRREGGYNENLLKKRLAFRKSQL